jgi:hypothetical protein
MLARMRARLRAFVTQRLLARASYCEIYLSKGGKVDDKMPETAS